MCCRDLLDSNSKEVKVVEDTNSGQLVLQGASEVFIHDPSGLHSCLARGMEVCSVSASAVGV